MTAESKSDLIAALQGADEYTRSLLVDRWGAAILLWVKEKKHPQHNEAILRHLADSIAGEGIVSPRRSRDICGKLRRERKKRGQIKRAEFYVECTCGYQGPAIRNACPKCGAPVPIDAPLAAQGLN